MTPKEKAIELVDKFNYYGKHYLMLDAKQCALIAVDEIIKSKALNYLFTKEQIYSMEETSDDRWIYEIFMDYWQEVKQEIINIS